MKKWHKKREKHRTQLRQRLRKIICLVRSGLGDGWKCPKEFFSAPSKQDREALIIAGHAGFNSGIESEIPSLKGTEFPWKKVRKAVKRIKAVNKKLVAFERGFISKDGIKDREWFKHLGVAPGKWLGTSSNYLETDPMNVSQR